MGGVAGVYTTPAIHVETTGVFTNTTPTGPYRGAGRPEATYAIERVIDVAAAELVFDPLELRRRNLIAPAAMPFKTGLVFTYDCGEFERIMELAVTLGHRRRLRRTPGGGAGARQAPAGPPIEVAGGPYTAVNPDTAEMRINADGSVSLFAGSTSMGQGNETAFAQIVADRLGLPPDRIQVFWGDSDALGAGRGNGGSGAISVGGSAVLRATDKIVEWAGAASPRTCSRPPPTTWPCATAGSRWPAPTGAWRGARSREPPTSRASSRPASSPASARPPPSRRPR